MNEQNNYRNALAYALNFHMQLEISTEVLCKATEEHLAYLVREFNSMYESELPGGFNRELIKEAWQYWADYTRVTAFNPALDYDKLIAEIAVL